MKKTTLISTFTLAFLMLFTIDANAQKFPGLDKSPMDAASYPSNYKNSDKLIKIIYSRPQLKDRKLEKLAPLDEVWRTGANEGPELTLYKPLYFGNTKIEAGAYTFYLIPGEGEWTAVISKDLNVWGSYFYDKSNDVARLSVKPSQADDKIESFSIVFEEDADFVVMHIGWEHTRLNIPFYQKF
ncbi:DUF2911 domain-containing protein [Psychroserpens sp.]|uniref:DUF2911 domain-containing protein n=1 Tax=Psychroserpens sp. TaxID=2020870 RepID=UPI00385E1D8A